MDTMLLVLTLAVAANTDGRVCFAPPNATDKWEVDEISFTPNVDSAPDGTNYVTLRAYKGASTPLVAAQTTASAGLTQGTPVNFPITATGIDKEISQTSPLSFRCTKSGSGVAVNGTVKVSFRRARV